MQNKQPMSPRLTPYCEFETRAAHLPRRRRSPAGRLRVLQPCSRTWNRV